MDVSFTGCLKNNNAGSCTLIKPDGKKIEFEVDEHDVPYLMEHRSTAVPASIDDNKENTRSYSCYVVSPLLTLKWVKADPGPLRMIELHVIED